MTHALLCGIIAFQIIVFQFCSPLLTRLIASMRVGLHDLPPEIGRALEDYQRRVAWIRRGAGALLLLVAVATVLRPMGIAGQKLVLTAISLASSLVFATGALQDRRTMDRIGRRLPDSGVRSASLEPRRLGHFYPVAWEGVPVVIFLATLGLALWAAPTNGGEGLSFFLPVTFQFTYLILFGAVAFRLAYHRILVPQSVRGFVGTPEQAVALESTMRRLKLRTLLMVRIGVALLMGLFQASKVIETTGRTLPAGVSAIGWGLVIGMVAAFGGFLIQSARARRQIS